MSNRGRADARWTGRKCRGFRGACETRFWRLYWTFLRMCLLDEVYTGDVVGAGVLLYLYSITLFVAWGIDGRQSPGG